VLDTLQIAYKHSIDYSLPYMHTTNLPQHPNLPQRLRRQQAQQQAQLRQYKLGLFCGVTAFLFGASLSYTQTWGKKNSVKEVCAEHQVFRASDQKCYVMQGE
jgi:hypothetical protein